MRTETFAWNSSKRRELWQSPLLTYDNGECYAFWGNRITGVNPEGGNHDNGEFYAFWGSRSTKEKKKVEIMIMDIGEIYAFWGSDTKITPLIEIIFFKPYL